MTPHLRAEVQRIVDDMWSWAKKMADPQYQASHRMTVGDASVLVVDWARHLSALIAEAQPQQETACCKRDDGQHCNCWYDGKACCACGSGATEETK